MSIARVILLVYVYCAIIAVSGTPPLLLTPLIDSGRLEEAKNLSLVEPLLDDIRSYAGYLTVNQTSKSHLYFWFFPSTNTRRTSAPLILWLQGGPGATSLYGLFEENGPFEVTDDGRLRRREHAWTNLYHVLYIDQPVGTGFSFAEHEPATYATEEEVAENLYEALVQFYKLFHEFDKNDLYVAGESYAGKYIPAVGHKIHTTNRTSHNVTRIPLKGMMIGNGYSDPENMLEYGEYLYRLELIDEDDRVELEALQEDIKYLIRSDQWLPASHRRETLNDWLMSALNSTSIYDYTRDNFRMATHPFVEFVSNNRTRERIHAYVGTVFELAKLEVNYRFNEDQLKTVKPWVEELLEYYPMLFYSGQFDLMIPHSMTTNFLRLLRWSGARTYGYARRQTWHEDNAVAGFYKVAKNLVDVLVRNAGHLVPRDQPKNALALINMFIEGRLRDTCNATSKENWLDYNESSRPCEVPARKILEVLQ